MLINAIRYQEKDDIQIVNISWDRIYLHIKLEGSNLASREFAVATRREKYLYPVKFNEETSEVVLNITNIYGQQMLENGDWYLKYRNEKFDEEKEAYEAELQEYKELKAANPGEKFEKPWRPYRWKDIPATLEVCYSMKDLDKIYRYSANNYAYIVTFAPLQTREELICTIKCTFMVKQFDPHKRYFTVETKKRKKQFKKWLIYTLEKLLNILYQIVANVTPKNGKNILIMSETRDMGGNLKALDDRLKERGLDKEYNIRYHFFKTLEHKRPEILLSWIKLAFQAGRADFIFVDDYTPFYKYVDVHPKTTLTQVWHAGVGFKSVGYARFGEAGSPYPYASSHRKYDYAIVGGEALRDVYAEVFGIDRENCLPFGLMRMDGYMEQERIDAFRTQFYEEYPQLKDKKIILFAPTFRGKGQRTANYPYSVLEQDKIYEMCGDEYVFLIKMHPFVRKRMEIEEQYQDKIIEFSDFPDINQLFYVTDILITDYSSNIYEYALQKKPIISFAYDKDQYELIRSVHRSLDKYAPGKVCQTMDELVDTIKNEDFEMDRLYKFLEENYDDAEGYASDRVIDYIILGKKHPDEKPLEGVKSTHGNAEDEGGFADDSEEES